MREMLVFWDLKAPRASEGQAGGNRSHMLRLAHRRPRGPALWGLGSCHVPALTKRQSPESTCPRCVGGGELLHKNLPEAILQLLRRTPEELSPTGWAFVS